MFWRQISGPVSKSDDIAVRAEGQCIKYGSDENN